MRKRRNILKKMMIVFLTVCTVCGTVEMSSGAVVSAANFTADYIIPDSASRMLSEVDISSLSLQELNYAKNEIYARHGRIFKSDELMNYFNSKSWYHGTIRPEDFKDEMYLSRIERANVALLYNREHALAPDGYKLDQGYGSSGTNRTSSVNYGTETIQSYHDYVEKDLDGDGSKEAIEYIRSASNGYEFGRCKVTINGSTAWDGEGYLFDDGFHTVSLDGKTFLIIIYDEGPSDDPESTFLRYAGNQLTEIGIIYDVPTRMSAGNMTIKARERCDVLETGSYSATWVWDGNNSLRRREEPFYEYIGYAGSSDTYSKSLKNPIEVYDDLNERSACHIMEPQRFRILYTDTEAWVYLEGETGDGGWVQTSSMDGSEKAYYFDNLIYAG